MFVILNYDLSAFQRGNNMKVFTLLSIAILATSCGVTEGLSKNCGSDIKMGCNLIFGMKDQDQDKAITAVETKNGEQDLKIKTLQESNLDLISTMNSLSAQIQQLEEDDVENKEYLIDLIESLEITVGANLLTLQSFQASLTGSVTKMIDVCGDHPGYFDEIVLKTNAGKYIAYFEDGGRRFLSELPVGTYESTDRQRCSFIVSAAGLTHAVGATVRID